MGRRHQEAGRQQRLDLTSAQDVEHAGADDRRRRFRGLGHHQRAHADASQDRRSHPQQIALGDPVEGVADGHHRHDETDRTPRPDLAVAPHRTAEMIEGEALDQRQRGTPEEGHQRHREKNTGKALGHEEAAESDQAGERREPNDGDPAARAISDQSPQIGRDDAHHLHQRHQYGNVGCGKGQRLEIQREIRSEGPDEREVEKVVGGQPPERNHGGDGGGSPPAREMRMFGAARSDAFMVSSSIARAHPPIPA